ncbi:MAG: V-type ATP synthase subunit I [Archaeoglobaceae archaeon]
MLKPVEMSKISVVGSREHLDNVSEILHRINSVHLEDPGEEEYFKLGSPFKKASEISRNLVLLRGYLSHLQLEPEKIVPGKRFKKGEIESNLSDKLSEFQEGIGDRIEEIRQLTERSRALEEEKTIIEPLKVLGISPQLLRGYKNLKAYVGYLKADPTEKLKQITSEFEVVLKPHGKEYTGAVFVRTDYSEDVFRVLQEIGFRELSVPDVQDLNSRLREIENELSSISSEKQRLESEIQDLKDKEKDSMLALEEYLSIELDKSELPLKSLVSKYAFFIVGYVPEKDFEEVENQIKTATNNKVTVGKLNEDEEESEPPTKLNNVGPARDFELFTKLYNIPKSIEADPTWIITIFFPLFFGMMLGDIGYGLIIAGAAFYLKRIYTTENWNKLLNMAMYSGISAIIFGFIYGELFGPFIVPGYEHNPQQIHFIGDILYGFYAFNHNHPLFDRVEAWGVKVLLFTTLAIGIVKILWGFGIGFRNVFTEHGLKEAILEKASWFIGVAAMSLLIIGFSWNVGVFHQLGLAVNPGNVPPLPIPGLVDGWEAGANVFYKLAIPLLVVWFVLFLMEEIPAMGPMGVVMGVEILTWFGQILSYARILAIGLSSVYIAFVINFVLPKLIYTFIPITIVAAVLAAIVIILGHLFNTLLGILDPGLQALRLQYVEFFTKFFEGGGKEYKPFGRVRRFIED